MAKKMFQSVPLCSKMFQCSTVPNLKTGCEAYNNLFFMSKQTIAEIILIVITAIAGLVAYLTRYDLVAGIFIGISLCFLILSRLGRRKANKAVDHIEKRMRDYKDSL
jgi:hypothetical protein